MAMDFSLRRPPRAAHSTIPAQLRTHWEILRGDSALPPADSIDLSRLAGAVERSFIVERVAPGLARFRQAGQRLADLMGTDPRGLPLASLIVPRDRIRFAKAVDLVFSSPSILEARLDSERGFRRPALTPRLLMLPLADEAGQPTLALGCIALGSGPVGRTPRRFGIARLVRELVQPEPAPAPLPEPTAQPADLAAHLPPEARPLIDLADSDSAFRPLFGRGRLRLVRNSDRED